ncbi:MAG TPA: hypothetical protein VFH00_05875 [Candidatus Nitrosotalea sp.]|nr:hypothetical protein [Candidatus Nitrosotalea sp.]
MTGSLSRYASTRLGGKALAGFSALLGLLTVVNAPAVAHLCYHFGLTLGEAVWVATMVGGAFWVITAFFPQLAPVIVTIRVIMFWSGTGAVIGW